MRIDSFDPVNKTVNITDFSGHQNVLPFSDVCFLHDSLLGEDNIQSIVIRCPSVGCQNFALFPISSAEMHVQPLFIYLLMERVPGRTLAQAKTLAKMLTIRHAGITFWVSEGV